MPSKRLLAFTLLCTTPLLAQTTKRAITIDDLAQIRNVGAPHMSADGKWIAYTVSRIDTKEDKSFTEIFMTSWDGTQTVQVTYGPESAGSPRFSPDGKYLAFTSSRADKEKGSQIWLIDRRGGEAHQITELKQNINDYRWTPDSSHLLLTLTEKSDEEVAAEKDKEKDKKPGDKDKKPKPIVIDRYHYKQDIDGYLNDKHKLLYLYDIGTKKLDKLTSDSAHDEESAEVSPDGQHIAFVSSIDADPDRTLNTDIFVIDAKPGSAARKLTTFTGPDSGPLSWSPDSKQIAYLEGVQPKYTAYSQEKLAVVGIDGSAPHVLTASLDRPVGEPLFSADGHTIYVTVVDDRNRYVAEVPVTGGSAKRIVAQFGSVANHAAAAGHAVVLYTNDTAMPELYAIDGDNLRKLSSYNDALIAQLALQPAEDITSHSADGTEVHSLLTRPLNAAPGTKAPLLLRIHGGPNGEDEHAFTFDRQYFSGQGYAVLNVNYRGSDGRGTKYQEAIFADWGNKEVVDLIGAVDQIIKQGIADPNRLGIGGWSYGGILTDYTIATDTRFKAAISGASSANQISMYGVDQYTQQYDDEIGPPWKNQEGWIKVSYPFFHADRIKTPTLFMGGESDFNVPIIGTEQMFQALKSIGTPTQLIIYPGQFHGFTRPSFIRDRYIRWTAWYGKYLSTSPGTMTAAATN
jgi:dipeptidyl aminopeptidase/acylaminoacyl peptidase